MTLPRESTTADRDGILWPHVLACAVGAALIVAMVALTGPRERPYTQSTWTLLAFTVLSAVALAMVFLVGMRTSREMAGKAITIRMMGVDRAAGAVEAFLEDRGIAHSEVPGRTGWRVFEFEGGRRSIEVRVSDKTGLFSSVLVGPVPEGDDQDIEWMLAGLNDPFEHRMRAQQAR